MKCPYCKNTETFIFYSAQMPNILSACPESMLPRVKCLPFEARLCKNCLLGFNATQLSEGELREIYDHYLYISPMDGIGRTKYEGMLETIRGTCRTTDKIVEIGSSDGYLLSQLRELGFKDLTGIEPGPQADKAQAIGLSVIKSYFDRSLFKGQLIDVFYLMHVFEHFINPFEVLGMMKQMLSPGGFIIIEVPNLEGFHHQHLYFYNMLFIKRLCCDMGLKIVSAQTDDAILRVVLGQCDSGQFETLNLDKEKDALFAHALSKHMAFKEQIERLNSILRSRTGEKVYWWGAGSTAVVYLNQLEQSIKENVQIEVYDGDKNKWDCYIPGLGLQVKAFHRLRDSSIDCLIIASQFHREIHNTLQELNVSTPRIEVFGD